MFRTCGHVAWYGSGGMHTLTSPSWHVRLHAHIRVFMGGTHEWVWYILYKLSALFPDTEYKPLSPVLTHNAAPVAPYHKYMIGCWTVI